MANYRGPVAFGFDPPDAFWTDENTFEKFVIDCFKGMGGSPEDTDFGVYNGEGFKLADSRDTAGAYGKADSVEDFVNDNLDLSTCPDTSILDAYVNVDEARLVVKVLSSDTDIAEIKHWELTPYETMTLERVDSVGDDIYELIFKIRGFNKMYKEQYDENKTKVFDKILNESYDDDYKAWKSADDNFKASKNAARKDTLNIKKKHKWSRDYLSNADELIGAGQYATDEFERSMKKWIDRANNIPELFAALIKCLLASAPWIVGKLITGTIKLSEIPAAIDDKRAKALIREIEEQLQKEELGVKDLHKTMVNTYNAENTKLEVGEKARCNDRVVTLVKPMEGDRWQVKYSDGHKETVSKDLIKPYKTELSARKELYGEDIEKGGNLRESARARLSVELRQFVGRFVQDMETAREGIKDYDEMMDALAELAIREANWVGLPIEVLRNLNFILSDDCLNCDMWDLVNSIIKLTNKKDN